MMLKRTLIKSLVGILLLCLSVSTAQAKTASLSNALLLVTDNAAHDALSVRPIDPLTLQDVPGYSPLSMGHHYVTALSPDRKTLAAIMWPSSWGTGGSLHLIDLTTWKDEQTIVTFSQYVSALYFSRDGNTLYWVQPIPSEAARDIQDALGVFSFDIGGCGPVLSVVDLPNHFIPYESRLLKSGTRLAIYGIPTDREGLPSGAPQVVLVDLQEKRIAATLKLENLKAGIHHISAPNGSTDTTAYEENWAGLAWNLDANLLYIAHPTGDQLTVIDLVKGSIARQIDFSVDRGMDTAKGLSPGTERMALLNPANNRLYVSTYRHEETTVVDGKGTFDIQPLGIRSFDVRQMRQLGETDLPLFEMMLSPNGRYLLATGTRTQQSHNQVGTVTYSGLYILDAVTLQPLKHLEVKEQSVSLRGFSKDSRYAYFSVNSYSDGTNSSLRVIELNTLTISAERADPPGFSDLLGTLNGQP